MRSQGVTNIPDPETQPPSNIQDYSLAEQRRDLSRGAKRRSHITAPAFRQAAQACGFH